MILLDIDWQLRPDESYSSEKDMLLPSFNDIDWEF
jgi:dTDP-4-dehydrorhamnose 3,5-epimerase